MSFKTTLCTALDRRKIIGMTAPMSLTSILIVSARAAMATEELSPPFNVSNHRLSEQPLEGQAGHPLRELPARHGHLTCRLDRRSVMRHLPER